jgi:hypothetical protein
MVVWPASQVAMVRNAGAREVLTDVGLPKETPNSGLFEAMIPTRQFTVEDRGLTQIGAVPEGDAIYVDNSSGEVVSGSVEHGELWHVNATVHQFLHCLTRIESSFPLYASLGLAAFADAESRVRGYLEEIDNSVLDETGGFWDVFLHGVGLGDYA